MYVFVALYVCLYDICSRILQCMHSRISSVARKTQFYPKKMQILYELYKLNIFLENPMFIYYYDLDFQTMHYSFDRCKGVCKKLGSYSHILPTIFPSTMYCSVEKRH